MTKQVIDETISVFAACGRFLEQHSERRYHDNRIVEIYNGMAEIQPSNLVRISKKLNLDFLPAALFLEAEREGHCRRTLPLCLYQEKYVKTYYNLESSFTRKWKEVSRQEHGKIEHIL